MQAIFILQRPVELLRNGFEDTLAPNDMKRRRIPRFG
jgi:hypothetical protein